MFSEWLPYDPGPDVGGLTLQKQMFSDGEVTFAEYEQAMTAGIQCMRDEGFQVEGPLRYPDGGYELEVGYDPTHELNLLAYGISQADDARWSDVNQRCQAQWYEAVQGAYLAQFVVTGAELRAWLERAWTCAKEKGRELSNPPTESEALDSVVFGCRPWEDGG